MSTSHDVSTIVARNATNGTHKVNCNAVTIGMDTITETYYTIDVDKNGAIATRNEYIFSGIGHILTFIRGTSVQSPTLASSKIMIISNIDCNVAWGNNPTATVNSTILQSRQPYIISVEVGNKLAILPIAIAAIPTTYLYINELN